MTGNRGGQKGTRYGKSQVGNVMLWRNFDRIIKEAFPTKAANELKVFIPLCGKTNDLYYFYRRGLTVVGVEYAAQPIKEFFEENNLEVKQPNGIGVFTETADSRLCIGQGDLLNFTGEPGHCRSLPVEKYEHHMDRGAFDSINVKKQATIYQASKLTAGP
ncbi:TPMT [Bugula neritina]|uniref:TPMT n=1 Tax=Bugula neritina TaxID=10212 RepID=A0A7J7KIN2_BUGNE|nr:TPMT [Bugula neritina]